MSRLIFFVDEDGYWYTNNNTEWVRVSRNKGVIESAPQPRLRFRLKMAWQIIRKKHHDM